MSIARGVGTICITEDGYRDGLGRDRKDGGKGDGGSLGEEHVEVGE